MGTGVWVIAESWIGVGVVFALALALRLVRLDLPSLSIDEGYTIAFTRQPWDEVAGLNGYYDFHPPLFYTLAKLTSVFASDAVAARVVAALAGALSVVVFCLLCDRLLGRRVALAASVLLAVSPLHLYLSRWGRMYTPMLLAVLLSYLALVAYSSEQRRRWAVLYGASLVAAMYIDYSAVYALAPQALLLGLVVARRRLRSASLVAAVLTALVLYLPWAPQLIRSSEGASNYPGRVSLELTWSKVTQSLTMILGVNSIGFRERTGHLNAWERWPDDRALLLLGLAPAVALGCVALARSRLPTLVAVLLAVGTPVTAIGISLISPGYAPRTVLAAVPGFAIIASASFARSLDGVVPRWLRLIGAASWCFAVAVCVVSWPPVYLGGTHDRWPEVTNALATQSHLGKPIVTVSSAGIATDLISTYAGDRLDGAPLLTVILGDPERLMGIEHALKRGPTLADIEAGALAELLPPGDPRADAFWLVATAKGESFRPQIEALGYNLVTSVGYYKAVIDLYARPDATLGGAIDVNGGFAGEGDSAFGWGLPRRATTLLPAEGDVRELVVTGTDEPVRARRYVDAGAGLYTLDVAVLSSAPEGRVVLACTSASGDGLVIYGRELAEARGTPVRLQVGVMCPDATTGLTILLEQSGKAELTLADVRLSGSPAKSQGVSTRGPSSGSASNQSEAEVTAFGLPPSAVLTSTGRRPTRRSRSSRSEAGCGSQRPKPYRAARGWRPRRAATTTVPGSALRA